jgi:hypothetical protein
VVAAPPDDTSVHERYERGQLIAISGNNADRAARLAFL